MKLFRTTTLLALVAVALAVFTFLEFRKAQREGGMAEDERPAFSFRANEVDHIRILRDDQVTELKKEDGAWKMIHPVADEGEEASIYSFLATLTTQRMRYFQPNEDEAAKDWEKYGLQKPVLTFEIGANGKTESLTVGSKNAFDGSFYLRRGDEIWMGDPGFAQLIEREPKSFRWRQLWREKQPVEKAEVQLESTKYSVRKMDGRWELQPSPSFAVDSAKVEAWIDRVQEFRAAEVVKDDISEEDRRTYLMLVPSASIRFNEDWLLTLGQDRSDDVFAMTSRRPTLYKTSAKAVAQLRVTQEFFRDGRKAFEFPLERARSIHIRAGKVALRLEKKDSTWLDEKGADRGEQAVEFMQALRGLEAQEFPKAGARTGLATPPQVVIKDGDGKDLLSLAWGDDFKAQKPFNSGVTLRYARTNLEKDVLGLAKDKIEALVNTVQAKVHP